MNILYWLENFPKLSETFVTNEIREFRRRGHTVAVYSQHSPDPIPDDLSDLDHYTAPDPFDIPPVEAVMKTRWWSLLHGSFLSDPLPSLNPLRQLYTLFHVEHGSKFINSLPYNIDHVHGHLMFTPQISANYISRNINVPHSVWGHANDLYAFDHEPTHRYLLENCDLVLAPCEYNRHIIQSLVSPAEAPNVDVVPAGFNTAFEPTDGYVQGRILSVSRHVEKKGIKYGLDAISKLPDSFDIDYHIASDGPLTEDLKEYAASLDITDQVSFLGRVSIQRLEREFDEAQLFLLPAVIARNGDRDAAPVAIKEAMSMKTPIVSTVVGGIPELVNEQTGYLVKPRNVPELSEALEIGLCTSSSKKGRAAYEEVQSHRIEKTVDQLEEKFEDLASA